MSIKKLASVNLNEKEINVVVDKVSCISERFLAIGDFKGSIDINRECLEFVRGSLGRLDFDDSPSLMRDGVRLNHLIICRQLVNLGEVYSRITRSSETDSHWISNMSEARELLMQRKDAGMNEPDIWQLLLMCDRKIYELYIRRGPLEKAKYHCVEWVATARQCNVPDQVDYLITALGMLSDCLRYECNFLEALPVAEESYTIASKHYSPAHKTVMRAAAPLIDCFIEMKDYSTADTYSRMNYANIIDPINAEEYVVEVEIDILVQLVKIWLRKEPDDDEIVEKALADEAIGFARKIFAYSSSQSSEIQDRIFFLSSFCQVLSKGNVLTEETEGFLHELLMIRIAENNLDGKDVHTSFMYLKRFYLNIYESSQMGEKTTLLQENLEVCGKKLLEYESCNDGSDGYVYMSQNIKPYFEKNHELLI